MLIVCLSEIIRLTSFFQGLLNDFYGIASIMLRIVLLCLFCGIVYGAFKFAPEANVRTEYPLTIRPIDSSTNPIEGLLIERQGGADKRALVIIAEALPYSGKPETLAALLADQGYTVAEITELEPRGIILRIELYRKLLPLLGKKEQRYLAKETNPEIAAFFAEFLEKTVARYGRNKRIFLYAEGIYTDLAAHFCTENPGVFTGVFFCLSEEEPLPWTLPLPHPSSQHPIKWQLPTETALPKNFPQHPHRIPRHPTPHGSPMPNLPGRMQRNR